MGRVSGGCRSPAPTPRVSTSPGSSRWSPRLANLVTPRFFQYTGPIPAATGLDAPQLVIEVHLGGDKPETRTLRISQTSDTQALATTTANASGPVFLLTGPSWSDLVKHVPGAARCPKMFSPPRPANRRQERPKPRGRDGPGWPGEIALAPRFWSFSCSGSFPIPTRHSVTSPARSPRSTTNCGRRSARCLISCTSREGSGWPRTRWPSPIGSSS